MPSVAEVRRNGKKLDDADLSAVKTLRKALVILDAFAGAQRPLSVAEAASRAGITRPTAYRLIQTMVAEGYLAQDPRDGRIGAGYSVLRLAGTLLDSNRLRLESLRHLETLAKVCGERANLGILHRNALLYLAGVEKPSLPTIYSRFGKTVPAHGTALGKAIIAHLSDEDAQVYIDAACASETPPGDQAAVRAELDEIRRRGFALDEESHLPGVYCVAAPIVVDGVPLAAIGVTGRSPEPLSAHADIVRHSAEVISHVLSRDV